MVGLPPRKLAAHQRQKLALGFIPLIDEAVISLIPPITPLEGTYCHMLLSTGCPRMRLHVISTEGRNLKLAYFQYNKLSRSVRNDNVGAF